ICTRAARTPLPACAFTESEMDRTAGPFARRSPATRRIPVIPVLGGFLAGTLAGTVPAQALHWRELLPANNVCGMVFDAARTRFVTMTEPGPCDRADMREWDGSAWRVVPTVHTPGWRGQAALVYDRARRRTVLFGGYTAHLTEPRDLWE